MPDFLIWKQIIIMATVEFTRKRQRYISDCSLLPFLLIVVLTEEKLY
jgi:hypothetical protein